MLSPNFQVAIERAGEALRYQSHLVHTEKWQGVDIQSKPEMATYEVLNHSMKVPLSGNSFWHFAEEIKPNLPWADDHFEERVCGQPINPGKTWEWWPHAKSASGHLDNGGKFNHNYMERYWPKYAGWVDEATDLDNKGLFQGIKDAGIPRNKGIHHDYGDLNDIVGLLAREPGTRQAYLPIFFPEDTGALHGGRLPCSLGYHFIQRGGYCHIVYYLRSCDFTRHFRDDIYLTVRLLLWVIERTAERSGYWKTVKPGFFTMHITSLHCFKNDYRVLFGRDR